MKVKITTTQNICTFEGEVKEIHLPTEQGTQKIDQLALPNLIKLIPGILSFTDQEGSHHTMSISKGIALTSSSEISITASTLTTSPLKKITELRNNQYLLELKLQKLKTSGNIEDINILIFQLEKLKADIQLAEQAA